LTIISADVEKYNLLVDWNGRQGKVQMEDAMWTTTASLPVLSSPDPCLHRNRGFPDSRIAIAPPPTDNIVQASLDRRPNRNDFEDKTFEENLEVGRSSQTVSSRGASCCKVDAMRQRLRGTLLSCFADGRLERELQRTMPKASEDVKTSGSLNSNIPKEEMRQRLKATLLSSFASGLLERELEIEFQNYNTLSWIKPKDDTSYKHFGQLLFCTAEETRGRSFLPLPSPSITILPPLRPRGRQRYLASSLSRAKVLSSPPEEIANKRVPSAMSLDLGLKLKAPLRSGWNGIEDDRQTISPWHPLPPLLGLKGAAQKRLSFPNRRHAHDELPKDTRLPYISKALGASASFSVLGA
jgi:hypothetical protein